MSDFSISVPGSTTIENLLAGGPGSGRHKEFGGFGSAKEQIENHLKKLGFKVDQFGSQNTDMTFWRKNAYRAHDQYGGEDTTSTGRITHTIAVKPDGSFIHTEEGSHIGRSLNDLTGIHLAAAAKKMGITMTAGGPGSGRKPEKGSKL